MFQRIRQSKFVKIFTIYYLLQFVVNFIFIEKVYAKPNGPSQPEMQGPSAVNYDDLVDLFTGDFHYSIPLFEMGDIPLTLNYAPGNGMNEDASWVGLGWSLNPGAITRTVRGLPDDFNGDLVNEQFNQKDNETFGVSVEGNFELFGYKTDKLGDELGLQVGLEINTNNYKGWGMKTTFGPSISMGEHANLEIGLNGDSDGSGDIGISPSIKFTSDVYNCEGKKFETKLDLGVGYSSVYGLQNLSLKGSVIKSQTQQLLASSAKYVGGVPANLFVDQTYTPSLGHSYQTAAQTFHGAIGFVATYGGDIQVGVSGYHNIIKLAEGEKDKNLKAYGYLYLKNDIEGDFIEDYNRENDGTLFENASNLPIGYLTEDVFTISSPGLSGNFRAYRNDIGFIDEGNATMTSNSESLGAEFSFGSGGVSPGVDIAYTNITSSSNAWRNGNDADGYLSFKGKQINSSSENVYFQLTSEHGFEKNIEIFNDNILGKAAVQYVNLPGPAGLTGILTDEVTTVEPHNQFGLNRETRLTNIEYKTVEQVDEFGIKKYKKCDYTQPHHISEIIVTTPDGTRYVYGLPAYNISQSEVVFNVGTGTIDGGIATEIDEERNLIKYTDGHASTSNNFGSDHYFNKITTPAYAYAFLLTEILSPNYVDVTGNGPTEDDLGDYLLYTYGLADDDDADGIADVEDSEGDLNNDGLYLPNINNYKWRTPNIGDLDGIDGFNQRWANYSKGHISDKSDDKANYIFGEKEIWYLNNIESKNYKAVFTLSDRTDALGVVDANGEIDLMNKLSKIDKVELYSKDEITDYTYWHAFYLATPSTSDDTYAVLTPIKTVFFEYDYSLCPGVPNKIDDPILEGLGKLTLKKIYSTYNNSNKAKFNPYSFEYSNNFEYNAMSVDRWGNYKPNNLEHPNSDFPYVSQNDENLNSYASAWAITAINSPTGGRLEITYESDDYGYVQDKPSTQMYEMIGAVQDAADLASPEMWQNRLYTVENVPGFDDEYANNNYLIFKLPNPIPSDALPDGLSQEEANELIREKCFYKSDLGYNSVRSNIYFRFLVNMDDDLGAMSDVAEINETLDKVAEKAEFIAGYAKPDVNEDLSWAGALLEDGYYTKGYVKLIDSKVEFNGFDGSQPINPITKMAWSYAMQYFNYNVVNESPLPSESLIGAEVMDKLSDAAFYESIINLFISPNQVLRNDGFGKLFDPSSSMLRLGSIEGRKIGGGYRVSKILYHDNWEEMTKNSPTDIEFENNFSYGVEYIYKLSDGNTSGVASYEPLIGADEIALRYPATYEQTGFEYKYTMYQEYPFGESFFPAPVVGYSRVQVKSISHDDVNVNKNGSTVSEFYTSKDFPVKTTHTTLVPIKIQPSPIIGALQTSYENHYSASQGYSIEVNDMHGKLKKVYVYGNADNDLGKLISQQEYNYLLDTDGNLNNEVSTIKSDGSVVDGVELGVKTDFFVDLREQSSKIQGGALQATADISSPSPLIIPFLFAFATVQNSNTSVKTAVTTKLISRNGILNEIVTTSNGSRISQKNAYYDELSGVPILVRTENEFEDFYYTFTYPGYWAYKGLNIASTNSNFAFSTEGFDLIGENGLIDNSLTDKLFPGDEIGLKIKYSGELAPDEPHEKFIRCWVYHADIGSPGYYLIDRLGEKVNLTPPSGGVVQEVSGYVLKSGYKNTPNISIGDLVTKKLPFNMEGNKLQPQVNGTLNHKIIAANAIEYSESWQNFCTDGGSYVASCNCNSELTTEGDAFITMLYSLYNEGKINEEIELYRPTELPNIPPMLYQCNFNSILYDAINAVENTIDWVPTISTVGANTIFNAVIQGQDDYCNFDINFGSTSVTDLQTACNNPENYNFSIQIPEFADEDCNEIREFTITITNKPGLPTFNATGTCDDLQCLTLRHCSEELTYTAYCPGGVGDPVNPYLFGALGLWKPKAAYMYKTDRQYTYEADTDPDNFDGAYANIREDGVFKDFSSFWNFSEENGWEKNSTDWQFTAKSVLNNPFIAESENVNPLGIYSSSDFGYDNTLPIIVGSNAAYQEIGFENFEDEALFALMDKECNPEHFDFLGVASTKYAHTGNYSREIPTTEGSNYISYSHVLTPHIGDRETYPDNFTLLAEDCLPYFSPFTNSPAEKYIVTVWIKEDAAGVIHSFDDLDFTATLGTPLSIVETKSTIIEGWQRIEYSFTIPANSTGSLELKFLNSGENSIYIDDIRVQPADALTNCYIYDFRTQKVMAELDENHYATFYEYDEEGKLIRVKKETERGIMTIQEGRYYSKKSN